MPGGSKLERKKHYPRDGKKKPRIGERPSILGSGGKTLVPTFKIKDAATNTETETSGPSRLHYPSIVKTEKDETPAI